MSRLSAVKSGPEGCGYCYSHKRTCKRTRVWVGVCQCRCVCVCSYICVWENNHSTMVTYNSDNNKKQKQKKPRKNQKPLWRQGVSATVAKITLVVAVLVVGIHYADVEVSKLWKSTKLWKVWLRTHFCDGGRAENTLLLCPVLGN